MQMRHLLLLLQLPPLLLVFSNIHCDAFTKPPTILHTTTPSSALTDTAVRIITPMKIRDDAATHKDVNIDNTYDPTIASIEMRRRRVLFSAAIMVAVSAPIITGISSSSPPPARAMYETAPIRPDDAPGPIILPSGVTYEDLRLPPSSSSSSPANGNSSLQHAIEAGDRVNIQWVLKRSNGYLVDSSERNDGIPFIFTVGDKSGSGSAIRGLDEGIRGMRVGGIRRIIIPPDLAYVEGVDDGMPGPIPQGFGLKQRIRRVMALLRDVPGESLLIDVKVTRVVQRQ